MTIATIITALDLAPGSARVAARALQLARQHGAQLVAVHVIEGFPGSHDLPRGLSRDALLASAQDDALTQLRALVGPDTVIRTGTGRAHDVILQVARDLNADLAVIGPGVARGLRERVFGSTADRISRCAPCPVLIVRKDVEGPYQRVLTGMDFSAHAAAALRWAQRIAPQARQTLIHADEIPLGLEQSMLKTGTSAADIDRYRAARARTARRRLHEILTQPGLPGDADIRIRQGDPSTAILTLARRADLVVVGTQGLNAVAQKMLGSVARRVLRRAPCDTLAVPEP